MKVVSFNANGIRSAAIKGFFDWLTALSPDIVCLQETKVQAANVALPEAFYPAGYYCEYVDAEKKGYSGVAIYARQKPNRVIRQLGFESADTEGRYLQFDYDAFTVASMYFPSGTTGELRQAVKYNFLEKIETHLMALCAAGRPCILCGDYNIAHQAIDLKNWRANQKHSGFLPEERAWMDKLLGPMGFVDAFRVLNQSAEQYTWWSHRGQARAKNVGWRIDYQIITPDLASKIVNVAIYNTPFFSDHAPLVIEYNF